MKAYPLQWPSGWPKTEPYSKSSPKFKTTLSGALANLKRQIELMGGKDLILSSNYTLGCENPKESGVCAYFKLKDLNMAIPCDRWLKVEANVQAIALTIEAMRGMERWGAKHMITAMFSGFKALPAQAGDDYQAILGIPAGTHLTEIIIAEAFRRMAKSCHPDVPGGSADKFRQIKNAHDLLMQNVRK